MDTSAVEVEVHPHASVRDHDHHTLATLTWEVLTVTVKDTKGVARDVLKDVSGLASPGQMLAIMGPSGCGKSTLLDTLAGRLAASATQAGKIKVNGHETQLSYGRCAYVTQDEVLVGTMTVYETILYAARLRLDGDDAMHVAVAQEVLSDLGLTEVRDTAIGNWLIRGISGGQRRRVAIGCELVVSPQLLFLDEPTSGLDSAAAYHVISAVRNLCVSKKRTILAVIHQPALEVFAMFDQLTLLGQGHALYVGPVAGAAKFYADAGFPCPEMRSPPDHLLHMINADFDDAAAANLGKLREAYGGSPLRAQIMSAVAAQVDAPGALFEQSFAPPSAFKQTLVLTERALRNNYRDLSVYGMRVLMFAMLCICIGFVYFQLNRQWKAVYSRAALLFFTTAFLTFMSISAFPAFVADMQVFLRERLNGYYGVGAFVAANTLASLPFLAVTAVVSTCCVYFLAGLSLNPAGRFFYFILNLFLALFTCESLMMAMAPLLPHFLVGIAAGAGCLGLFMIVCGFFQPRNQLSKPVFLYPLHYLSFETYAFYGFLHNEFDGNDGWACPCSAQPGGCPPALGGGSCRLTGQDVLNYYDVPNWDKWTVSIIVQVCWAVFYRAVFYGTCKLKEARR